MQGEEGRFVREINYWLTLTKYFNGLLDNLTTKYFISIVSVIQYAVKECRSEILSFVSNISKSCVIRNAAVMLYLIQRHHRIVYSLQNTVLTCTQNSYVCRKSPLN